MTGARAAKAALAALALTASAFVVAPGARAAAPSNDSFASPKVFTAPGQHPASNNAEATLEAGEPVGACGAMTNSVWYRYDAEVPGPLAFSVTQQPNGTQMIANLWEGTTLAGLTPVGCSRRAIFPDAASVIGFTAVPGHTYYLQAGMEPGATPGKVVTHLMVGAQIQNVSGADGFSAQVASDGDQYDVGGTTPGPNGSPEGISARWNTTAGGNVYFCTDPAALGKPACRVKYVP